MSKYSLLHVMYAKRTKSWSTQIQGEGILITAHLIGHVTADCGRDLLPSCLFQHLFIHGHECFHLVD